MKRNIWKLLGILCLSLAGRSATGEEPGASPNAAAEDGRHDFDFIKGHWKVANRQLLKSGTNEWGSFDLDYEGWTMMESLANVDRIYGPRRGKYFEGVSVRTFDPKTHDWTIYWMDIRDPHLTECVRGHFEGNEATFVSADKETHFIWRRLGPDKAHWEQQVLLKDGHWETNWSMEFSRVSAP